MRVNMRSGLLKDNIEIQRPVDEVNEYHELVRDYKTLYIEKSQVIDDSGNREEINGEITHSYTKTFKVWYYVDVEETDLILFENHKYRILNIVLDKQLKTKIIKTERVEE